MNGSEPADGRVEHALQQLLALGGIEPRERAVQAEHRGAVHRGPQDVLKTRAAPGGDHADADKLVKNAGEQDKRIFGTVALSGRFRGRPRAARTEREPKQTWLVRRKAEIGGAERTQPVTGRLGRADVAARIAKGRVHLLRQGGQRPVLDGLDHLLMAGEVMISGGGGHTDPPRRLAHHDGVRAAFAGQRCRRADQSVAEIAVMVTIGGLAFSHTTILTAFTCI